MEEDILGIYVNMYVLESFHTPCGYCIQNHPFKVPLKKLLKSFPNHSFSLQILDTYTDVVINDVAMTDFFCAESNSFQYFLMVFV